VAGGGRTTGPLPLPHTNQSMHTVGVTTTVDRTTEGIALREEGGGGGGGGCGPVGPSSARHATRGTLRLLALGGVGKEGGGMQAYQLRRHVCHVLKGRLVWRLRLCAAPVPR